MGEMRALWLLSVVDESTVAGVSAEAGESAWRTRTYRLAEHCSEFVLKNTGEGVFYLCAQLKGGSLTGAHVSAGNGYGHFAGFVLLC
jgi:hypothetical protein